MTTELKRHIRNEIDAKSAVLEAGQYIRAAGVEEAQSCKITTATSELVSNILKYAGQGEIRVREVKTMGRHGIEIEASDNGPGIEDCDAAMQEHFSSKGTLGLGLPGVRRLMDEFSLDSTPGEGTTVRATKWI